MVNRVSQVRNSSKSSSSSLSLPLLKLDIHCHSSLDPLDGPQGNDFVKYSWKEAIDTAARVGIDVFSLTHHEKLIFTKEMELYASKRGILLLPGFEATIEGRHVVIINPSTDRITTFEQLALERKRNPSCFILAPHPYYPGSSPLDSYLTKHIELFDAIEYCHFHGFGFDMFNKKAAKIAKQYNLPLIGTSDAHYLDTIGTTYTLIKSQKNKLFNFIKV